MPPDTPPDLPPLPDASPDEVRATLRVYERRVQALIVRATAANETYLTEQLQKLLTDLQTFPRDVALQREEADLLGDIAARLGRIDRSLSAENPGSLQRVSGYRVEGLEYTHQYMLTVPRAQANNVYVRFHNLGITYENQGGSMVPDNRFKRCTTTQYTGLPRVDQYGRRIYDFCIWRPQYQQDTENVVIMSPAGHPPEEVWIGNRRIFSSTAAATANPMERIAGQASAGDAASILARVRESRDTRIRHEELRPRPPADVLNNPDLLANYLDALTIRQMNDLNAMPEFQSALRSVALERQRRAARLRLDNDETPLEIAAVEQGLRAMNRLMRRNVFPTLLIGNVARDKALSLVQDLNMLGFNVRGRLYTVQLNDIGEYELKDAGVPYPVATSLEVVGRLMAERGFGVRLAEAPRRLSVTGDPSRHGSVGALYSSLNGWIAELPAAIRNDNAVMEPFAKRIVDLANVNSVNERSPFVTDSGTYYLTYTGGRFSFTTTVPALP